jgi:hypothetical protein
MPAMLLERGSEKHRPPGRPYNDSGLTPLYRVGKMRL